MTGWPPWDRTVPEELVRFVQTGVLPKLVPEGVALPGRSDAPPEIRLRALFDAFVGAGTSYADEPFASTGNRQEVRTPDQIFVRPRHTNCLDLSVAFAGGCLDTGLHPIIVVLDPNGSAPVAHRGRGWWSSVAPVDAARPGWLPNWPTGSPTPPVTVGTPGSSGTAC